MIGIVDYGMGNLRSVQKAFERIGAAATICTRPEELERCEKMVLPGVGAFRDAIAELRKQDFVEPIKAHIAADRPFLGICLGLQLLFDVSHEDGEWEGLGVIPGEVVRFAERPGLINSDKTSAAARIASKSSSPQPVLSGLLKVPHMGWNQVNAAQGSPLLKGIPADAYFYFVHSYYVVPRDDGVVAARTDYGGTFASMIRRGALGATQFHPEKSQQLGLQLLRNFSEM